MFKLIFEEHSIMLVRFIVDLAEDLGSLAYIIEALSFSNTLFDDSFFFQFFLIIRLHLGAHVFSQLFSE